MIKRSVVLVLALFAAAAVPTLGLAREKTPATKVAQTQRRVQVFKTDVSVRTGPDTSKKEIAVANKGALADVLDSKDGWVKVRFSNSVEGWIHKSMLLFLPEAQEPAPKAPVETPALPGTGDEAALPDTPTRLATDVEKTKRLSISIGGGKASIRTPDGRVSEEDLHPVLRAQPKPLDPEEEEPKQDEPKSKQDGHYLWKPSDVPEPRMSNTFPPLETPRFAPKSKPESKKPNDELEAPRFNVENKSEMANFILQTASDWRGKASYRYGGNSPSRGVFDCSSFVGYVFAQAKIGLPRTAAEIFGHGTPVDKSALQPGDLVFFSSRITRVGHIGIYWGEGKFIHCSSGKGTVTVSRLDESYYTSHYVGARRILAPGQKLSLPVPDEQGSTREDG